MADAKKQVVRYVPYTLRIRPNHRNHKPLFEVPEWAGQNSVNTCIVDSFLAMLLCAQSRDSSLSSRLIGVSAFTQACRTFLDDNNMSMEDRKIKFIKKLFVADKNGEYDLEGDEVSILLEKAKEATTIGFTTHCPICDKRVTTEKDYYYGGLDKQQTMAQAIHKAISAEGKRHRCLNPQDRCKDAVKTVKFDVHDTTWMLPIDISQLLMSPEKITDLPVSFVMNEDTFRLASVSLFGECHYTGVLRKEKDDWYYYDGILEPALTSYPSLESMVFHPSYTLKIAYYLKEKKKVEEKDEEKAEE